MSIYLERAKEIVESFWRCKYLDTEDKGVLLKSLNVINAKPKELVKDYEIMFDTLGRALKEIKGEKNEGRGKK